MNNKNLELNYKIYVKIFNKQKFLNTQRKTPKTDIKLQAYIHFIIKNGYYTNYIDY
jgi:hypothetical protein